MILSILTYKLPKRWSLEEAAAVFKSTAPKYLGLPGLLRKHYCLNEAGDCVRGIYLWKSKADAEACYTAEWKAAVADLRPMKRARTGNPGRCSRGVPDPGGERHGSRRRCAEGSSSR